MNGYKLLLSFYLLLLLLCVLCKATTTATTEKPSQQPKEQKITVLKPDGINNDELTILYLRMYSLVGTDDIIFGLMQTVTKENKVKLLASYIETQGKNWDNNEEMQNINVNWKLQLPLPDEYEKYVFPSMVAKNNKLYLLVTDNIQPTSTDSRVSSLTKKKNWDFKFVVGTINSASTTSGKKIEWKSQTTPVQLFDEKFQKQLEGVAPVDASAFLTTNGALVFVIRALNSNTRKKGFVIVYSKDGEKEFKVSFVVPTEDCHYSFFSWGKKLFMVPEFCGDNKDKNNLNVQESDDMGETWKFSIGPLAEKINKQKGGKAFFTTTTIDEKRVLLFTEEKIHSTVVPSKVSSNLFMANNKCIQDLGQIVSDVYFVPYIFIYYSNNKLFLFSQPLFKKENNIFVKSLKNELKKVTNTLGLMQCEEEKEEILDVLPEDDLILTVPEEEIVHMVETTRSNDGSVHFTMSMTSVLLCLCVLLGL